MERMKDSIESPELQEMKQQIDLLKAKLSKQTIVSDTLLRAAMRRNVGNINRHGRLTLILCFVASPYCAFVLSLYGFTFWFCLCTVLVLFVSAVATYIHHRELWRIKPTSNDMLTIGRAVSRLKDRYVAWLRTAIVMIIFWFSWLVTECVMHFDSYATIRFFLPGAVLGVCLGGYIGMRKREKVIRQAEEVLSQIEELKQGEEA